MKLPPRCRAFVFLFSPLLMLQGFAAEGTFGFAAPNYFPAQSLGKFEGDILVELSGATVGRQNPSVLWVHNDGPITEFYAIGKTGNHVATVSIGVPVLDVEDIASTSEHLYIGDIGSNDATRTSVTIIRALEPRLSESNPLGGESASLMYPDGGHDAETLMVDPLTGNVYVASKESGRTRIYEVTPSQLTAGASSTMTLVAEVPLNQASGGDISSDGLLIALRNETEAFIWKRSSGESVSSAFGRPGTPIPVVGPPKEPNGEALAFEPMDNSYYTLSEGKKEPVFHYRPSSSGFDFGKRLGVLDDNTIKEASGCALSGLSDDVLWIHNDGPINEVFATDTAGRILARVSLGMTLTDAEDIAIGQITEGGVPYVFVGDIGDNDGVRPSVGLLRFPEPAIDPTRPGARLNLSAADPELLSVRYPGARSDAEALMIDPLARTLVVATKSPSRSTVFSIPADSSAGVLHTFSQIAEVDFTNVSAGDISVSGSRIILRREEFAMLWDRLPGQSIAAALAGGGREIPVMTPPKEGNGEGIALDVNGRGYFTIGEKKAAPIFYFSEKPISDLLGVRISLSYDGSVFLGFEGFPSISATLQRSTDFRQWQDYRNILLDSDGRGQSMIPAGIPSAFFRLRR